MKTQLKRFLNRTAQSRANKKCLVLFVIGAATIIGIWRFHITSCSVLGVYCSSELPQNKQHPLPTLDGVDKSWCTSDLVKPVIDGEPQTWQVVRNRNVLVFSAYIDKRVEVGGPYIRVVANGLQANYNRIGDLYCQLWYKEFDVAVSAGPAVYDLIYPSTLYPKMWVGHFILCPVPVDIKRVPYAVSVTADRCSNATNTLLVLHRKPDTKPSDTFALCLPPLYGRFDDWSSIVELIEIHKIFGVTEFTFYNFSAHEKIGKVLESYRLDREENVKVVQWHFPSEKLVNYFSQHDSLNDCLYRSASRYVAISDLDEVITPRKHSNWKEMMTQLSQPDVGAYLFQHAYFRRNLTSVEDGLYLVTQQSLWRTDIVIPAGDIRSKTLYVATKTIKANIHSPYQLTSGTQRHVVDPEVGMLHHYRRDPMESFIKHPENYRYIEDRHMLKYKQKLKEAVKRRIKLLKS